MSHVTEEQLCLLPPDPPAPLDRGLLAYCRQHGIPAVLPDTIEAGDAWGANCGPMALAAVLDLPTVEAARPLVQPFRGFMSPTDMYRALDRAGAKYMDVERVGLLGLVRIQWVGPWCEPGIDPRAAYRYTHWIGMRHAGQPEPGRLGEGTLIYDATPNRWIELSEWTRWCPSLWPKRATGWRMSTSIEVATGSCSPRL